MLKWWLKQPKTKLKSFLYYYNHTKYVKFIFKVYRGKEELFAHVDKYDVRRNWIEKL